MENKSPEDSNYKFKNCVNNFGIALMCIDQVDLTCAELSIRYREQEAKPMRILDEKRNSH